MLTCIMVTRVSIIAHEGGELPLEETLVDMLTQLFMSLKTSLETDILVDNVAYFDEATNKYHEQLKLVDQPLYKKIQVDRTEYIKNVNAELIIMLGHGINRKPDTDIPAALRFGSPFSDAGRGHSGLTVFAKDTDRIKKSDHTMLHDVIRQSKIVIMLACYGNEVVEDYLKYLQSRDVLKNKGDAYPMYPDILHCPGTVDNASVHIFTVLFINLLDSQVATLPIRDLHGDVRTVILRIMQIVQLFGDDYNDFWDFLKQVGCIADEKNVKRNQQLQFASQRLPPDCFRIYGHTVPNHLVDSPQIVFTDFKQLTLMSRGENGIPQYTTPANVDPILLTNESTGVTYVDTALKRRKLQNEYRERQQHAPVPSHFVAPSPTDSVERLLIQLKLSVLGKYTE